MHVHDDSNVFNLGMSPSRKGWVCRHLQCSKRSTFQLPSAGWETAHPLDKETDSL